MDYSGSHTGIFLFVTWISRVADYFSFLYTPVGLTDKPSVTDANSCLYLDKCQFWWLWVTNWIYRLYRSQSWGKNAKFQVLLQHSEYSETKQNRTLPPNTRTANPSLNIARTTESALNWFCTNNGSSDEIWSSSKGNLKDNLVAQSSRIQTDPIIWARQMRQRCMNI